ncbi:unnamed protein product [Hydatigera taeniaeformis]|uniref:GRAM domain-containing protein n=1 Tax=Hydatigena taeniaeformis TaxID=6205 RepID=A0A0R3WIS0_HYDTA|nr:unnamed protein product [Hydatigera taeniaeformis]
MSINTAHTHDGLGVAYYPVLQFQTSSYSFWFGSTTKWKILGNCIPYIVIFLSKDKSPALNSLSMPFVYMKRVAIKQPTFGPNHIEGFVSPESGQWSGDLPFKLVFNHGGAIEFGKSLLELGTRASKLRESYKTPTAPPLCEIYACPPPAYTPFVHETYPLFAVDFLYQTNSPPPYPGAVPPPYTPNSGPPPPYAAAAAGSIPPYPTGGPPPGRSGYLLL